MFPDFNSESLCAVKINDSNIVRGFMLLDILLPKQQLVFGSDLDLSVSLV